MRRRVKLLMFYSKEFWWKPFAKEASDVPDPGGEEACRDAVVIFYHAEAEDVGREEKVVAKFVKNAKWLAGKFDSSAIILHSFNHLSQSKAPLETALLVAKEARKRLEAVAYSVFETPFGCQNEWKIHVSGESLAKVFKAI